MFNVIQVKPELPESFPKNLDVGDWASVRNQFSLTTTRIHLATFFLVSHPRPVAEAIDRHRREFDENPVHYWHDNFMTAEPAQRSAAAKYLGTNPDLIVLTDSTTMGLVLFTER